MPWHQVLFACLGHNYVRVLNEMVLERFLVVFSRMTERCCAAGASVNQDYRLRPRKAANRSALQARCHHLVDMRRR